MTPGVPVVCLYAADRMHRGLASLRERSLLSRCGECDCAPVASNASNGDTLVTKVLSVSRRGRCGTRADWWAAAGASRVHFTLPGNMASALPEVCGANISRA